MDRPLAGAASRGSVLAAAEAVAKHKVAGPTLVVIGAIMAGTFIWFADPTTPGGIIPPCPTNAFLHINCPGCGSTRAIYSLLHGDIGAALHFNAFGVVALALLAFAFVAWVRGLWTGVRVRSWQHLRWAPMVVLVVTVGWFVIRNIPIEPFSSLKV
ncbi:MAG: DUF2752 domain-containing protein [Gordonia sp. (in: high G+C Gram-positive bacteria)]